MDSDNQLPVTKILLTTAQLAAALQCPLLRAGKWLNHINTAMHQYQIDTPLRMAHFLAQIGHESGRLIYVRELASGANYEGRKDLGNTETGDGRRYKGRGLIQITGRTNYKTCGEALGIDLINDPASLELPQYAAASAAWFWDTRKLNALADLDLLVQISKKINGGLNGIDDRRTILVAAKKALAI